MPRPTPGREPMASSLFCRNWRTRLPLTPGLTALCPFALGPFALGPFALGPFALGPFALGPFALGLIALGCGSQPLKVANPSATAGSSYECWEGSGCSPAAADRVDAIGESGAKTFQLPEQCAGHVQAIVVLEADSSAPVVYVTCAAGAPGPSAPGVDAGSTK